MCSSAHTCQDQLIPVGAGDIQAEPRARVTAPRCGPGNEPPVDEMPRVACRRKRIHQLGPDLIAAGANAGPDRHDHVLRA